MKKKGIKRKAIEPFILETKLIPPVLKEKTIIRPRLVSLLKENLNKKLILITANAGYGKTTLLAQLCTEFDKPYMFYDLDGSDNDLATFFNYIVTGIQRHYADFGERTKGILGQTRNIEILVGTFINEFVEHSRKNPPISPLLKGGKGGLSSSFIKNLPKKQEEISPHFYIILDDYHYLQQNKEVGNALDYLLRHLPINLHLIISSRSVPPLNLAYCFAKQELFRFEKKHLQFNLKEIQLLLKEGYGLNIPKEEIERIEKHSEGWITAIQLILQKISASGEEKAKETLNGYIASDREIFNYFAQEVYESQPIDIQDFLMKTSVLDWMNADLCDNFLQIKNSAQIISYLMEEHLFISQAENNFYYHHLWRDFLKQNLEMRFDKKSIKNLHLRTAKYFEKKRNLVLTIEHLLLSESFDDVAKLLQLNTRAIIDCAKFNTLINWIERLPINLLHNKYPRILLTKAEIILFHGKIMQVSKIFNELIPIFKQKRDYHSLAKIFYSKSMMLRREGDLKQSLNLTRKALRICPKRNLNLRATILAYMGLAYRQLSRYSQAEKVLIEAQSLAKRSGDDEKKNSIIGYLALVYIVKCEYYKSFELLNSIIHYYRDKTPPPWLCDVYGNAASLCLTLNEYKKVEELLFQAEKISKQYNNVRSIAYLSGVRGKLNLEINNYSKAIQFYERALELNRDLNELNLNINIWFDLCAAHILRKSFIDAEEYLNKVAESINKETSRIAYLNYLLLSAELRIGEDNIPMAIDILNKALKITKTLKTSYHEMQAHYNFAKIYLQSNSKLKAVDAIKKCFALCKKRRFDFYLIKKCKNDIKIFTFAINHKIEPKFVGKIIYKAKGKEIADQIITSTIPVAQTEVSSIGLRIRFFGGLEIQNDKGQPIDITWRSSKTKSLFCYLIANRNQRITKDAIIEMLWPNRGLIKTIHILHTNISSLRRTLKKLLSDGLKKPIIYRNGVYSLNPDINFWLDIEEFTNYVNSGKAQESLGNKKQTVKNYINAIDLYRGDYLNDIYETWCDNQRSYYKQTYFELVKKTGEFYYDFGDYNEALKIYQRALGFDKINEGIHCSILRCLAAIRDRKGLIGHYEKLKNLLKEKADTQPLPETTKIFEKLLKDITC